MDGLFALGLPPDRFDLPHPRLGLPVILLIRRVILRAFEILRERHKRLEGFKEDDLTTALRAIVENDLRQTGSIKGFSRRTFETVHRQGQIVSFDLTRQPIPDLCFKLRSDEEEPRRVLSEHDGLFVECKPVDKTHAAGSQYCDKGLNRFVDGAYAWAMEEGLMLGYARHGRTIEKHLLPAIQERPRLNRLKVVEIPRPIDRPGPDRADAEALHVSRHGREFSWPEGKGRATEILIYHSWHNCD